MSEIAIALRGHVRNSIARGTGRIEKVVAGPAEWEEVIGRTLVDLELATPSAQRFLGRVTTRGAVDILLTDIAAAPCRGTTGPSVDDAPTEYIFCHQVSGRGVIDQDGRTVTLAPGGFAVYAAHREADIEFGEGFRSVSLHVPGHLLDVPTTAMDQMTARDLTRPACGPVAALGQYLTWMNDAIDGARPDARGRMILTAVDLISAVVGSWAGGHSVAAAARTAPSRRTEILDYIERNLDTPALGPMTIANAHFMSVRSVHAVFEDYGETVGVYIRRRRLSRCARDLADQTLAHLSVAAVGRRWSFENASHFSELFRKAYDVSPSTYRRGHVDSAVAAE